MSRSGGAAFGAKVALARAIGAASRASGRGGGTTLPGRTLLRIEPDAIGRLGSRLSAGSTIVSATNGKTTTAGMIAAILAADGRRPVHNRAGSNMTWGVATALLEQRGEEGLFEVDEAWLPRVAEQLHPSLIVLGNLFRDQLDRYGELEKLADDWAAMVERRAGTHRVRAQRRRPADRRPRAATGRAVRGPAVSYFGIDDPSQALPELQHAHDAKHCRRCGHPYDYERAFVGHLGHYSCPSCGARRPDPEVAASAIELRGMSGSDLHHPHPRGRAAAASCRCPASTTSTTRSRRSPPACGWGSGWRGSARPWPTSAPPSAGWRRSRSPGVPVSILLIKNPAGTNEVLRTLRLESAGGAISISGSRSTTTPPTVATSPGSGTPTSSCWRDRCGGSSAPARGRRRWRCASSTPGLDPAAIEVEPRIAASLDRAVAGSNGRLFALPTYTALLELRRLLAERGLAKEFWE